MDSSLLGIWDSDTNEQYAKFRLHFLESGDLTCTIFVAGRASQVVEMKWSAEGTTLTTREASPPREDRIEYAIERDGRLMVRAGWTVCPYRRVFEKYEQAPEPPPVGDDGVGVTANKPWKPRPKRGTEAAEPPYSGSDC